MENYSVLLSRILAGHISQDEAGRVAFRFTEEFRRMNERPVLSQYFEDDLHRVYTGKRDGLPPFFANLVPEGALRALLERSFQVAEGDDLALLSNVGRDLPGAVEVARTEEASQLVGHERLDDLFEQEVEEVTPEVTPSLRFSLAGVQMKFSVLNEHDKITLPGRGKLGDWIVKLDSHRFPNLVENEYATLEWARASGFEVPDCQVLPGDVLPSPLRTIAPEGSNVFLIRRYDRAGSKRIHQEDFAQVVGLPPRLKYDHLKYEQCALLVRRICGEEGYVEFIRRLVFMVASGNMDAHLKNWSLIYPDGVNAGLSPLYDQVATVAWPDQLAPEWALKFASTKQLFGVDTAAFKRLAERAGGDAKEVLRTVEETIQRIIAAWREANVPSLLPREHLLHLREYWRRAPLLRAHEGEIGVDCS